MEEASLQVVEVARREVAEHFELLFLDHFEHKLLVVGSEESFRGFTSCTIPRLSLAD